MNAEKAGKGRKTEPLNVNEVLLGEKYHYYCKSANASLVKWVENPATMKPGTVQYLLHQDNVGTTYLNEDLYRSALHRQNQLLEDQTRKKNSDVLPSMQHFVPPADDHSFPKNMDINSSSPAQAENIISSSVSQPEQRSENCQSLDNESDTNMEEQPNAYGQIFEDKVLYRGKQWTVKRILQHWGVLFRIPQKAMDELLRLFIVHHPEGDYSDLPKSTKTLLKIPKHVKDSIPIQKVFAPQLNGPQIEIGEKMYFGVEKGVIGSSFGVLTKLEYAITLARAEAACPGILPKEMYDFMENILESDWNDVVKELPKNLAPLTITNRNEPQGMACTADKETCHVEISGSNNSPADEGKPEIGIHVNIDGVEWEKSNNYKVLPTLGRLAYISRNGIEVRIPKADPFIIGVYRGKSGYTAQQVCEDFVKEMVSLQVGSTSGGFTVRLRCMICDAPQRAELKGIIGHTGYAQCERCIGHAKRIPHPTKKGKNGKSIEYMTYPTIGQPPRTDFKWQQYKETDHPDDDLLKVCATFCFGYPNACHFFCSSIIYYRNIFLHHSVYDPRLIC